MLTIVKNAVIKKSSRVGPNIPPELPRIEPPRRVIMNRSPIAAETIVPIGSWLLHPNASIFTDPLIFDADRWLDSRSKDLEQNLVPFSRGGPMCLGFK